MNVATNTDQGEPFKYIKFLSVVLKAEKQEMLQSFKRMLLGRWLNLEQLFQSVDTNLDGEIDIWELFELVKSLGFNTSDQSSIKQLFYSFDSNGDGSINLAELSRSLEQIPLDLSECQNRTTSTVASSRDPEKVRHVALVAHNNMKNVIINFVAEHKSFFAELPLVTTGSTGRSLKNKLGIEVEQLVASGPLGGDQAIGGMISEGQIAAIFFFKDPLSSHAHASDIEALTRLCDVHQIPYATNPASAEGLMMSLKAYGLHWELNLQESEVVKSYKKNQQAVINSHSS